MSFEKANATACRTCTSTSFIARTMTRPFA
jgi:hypothetical protein